MNFFSYCSIQLRIFIAEFYTISHNYAVTVDYRCCIHGNIRPSFIFAVLPSLFWQILNWINLKQFFNYCVNYKRACIIYNILIVWQTLIQGEIVCKSKRAKKAGRKLSCIQYAFWGTYLYSTIPHCKKCIHKNHKRSWFLLS